MSVMTLKEILDLSEKIKDISNFMLSPESNEKTMELILSLGESSEKGKEIVLKSVSEEDFCELRNMVSNTCLTIQMLDGRGSSLLRAKMNGDLAGMVDSCVLAIIGILYEEGVL